MTVQTNSTTDANQTVPATLKSAVNAILGMARAAYTIMVSASHGARCAEEAKRLFALSDEQLARRGLRRDEVIQHAFRGFMAS